MAIRFHPDLRTILAVLLVTGSLAAPAAAQPAAVGEATMIVRSVHGITDSARRPLAVADAIFWLELIETGADSAAKLLFLDATTLSTGPETQVRIDEFVYAGGGESRRIVVGIARGVLRFVTGSSPSPAYSVRTPSAMIGVRGTDFTVRVDEQGATRIAVRRGEVAVTPASAPAIVVPAGLSVGIRPDGVPTTPEPLPPDGALQADGAEITALLAIAGEGETPSVFDDADLAADVAAVGGRRAQAASVRAATPASQLGAGCGGC